MCETAAPKARGNKRKLHGSVPTLLWNRNGPEMTCPGTIADLKAHEADMQNRAKVKAARKAKTFVDKVCTASCMFRMGHTTIIHITHRELD